MGLAHARRSVKDNASRQRDTQVGINLREAKRYLDQLLQQLDFIAPPADVFIGHFGDVPMLMLVLVHRRAGAGDELNLGGGRYYARAGLDQDNLKGGSARIYRESREDDRSVTNRR